MRVILTDQAPLPGGHYSQAVVHGDLVYVSGQLPIEPGNGQHLVDATIEVQVTRALENLAAILRSSGSDIDRVLKVTVYIADIALWPRVNAAYETFFGAHRPARAVVPTGPLHFGLQVEIEAVAALARPADATHGRPR